MVSKSICTEKYVIFRWNIHIIQWIWFTVNIIFVFHLDGKECVLSHGCSQSSRGERAIVDHYNPTSPGVQWHSLEVWHTLSVPCVNFHSWLWGLRHSWRWDKVPTVPWPCSIHCTHVKAGSGVHHESCPEGSAPLSVLGGPGLGLACGFLCFLKSINPHLIETVLFNFGFKY